MERQVEWLSLAKSMACVLLKQNAPRLLAGLVGRWPGSCFCLLPGQQSEHAGCASRSDGEVWEKITGNIEHFALGFQVDLARLLTNGAITEDNEIQVKL